jgi:hypothetical protein
MFGVDRWLFVNGVAPKFQLPGAFRRRMRGEPLLFQRRFAAISILLKSQTLPFYKNSAANRADFTVSQLEDFLQNLMPFAQRIQCRCSDRRRESELVLAILERHFIHATHYFPCNYGNL